MCPEKLETTFKKPFKTSISPTVSLIQWMALVICGFTLKCYKSFLWFNCQQLETHHRFKMFKNGCSDVYVYILWDIEVLCWRLLFILFHSFSGNFFHNTQFQTCRGLPCSMFLSSNLAKGRGQFKSEKIVLKILSKNKKLLL